MAAEAAPRLRTAPELATLLLELGRLIRARRFYPPGDPRLAAVFERSLRAWRSDLGRRGALDIELLPEGFRESGARGVLAHPRLGELEQDLAERGVRQLRFEADLDGEVFAALAEVLATDAGRTQSRGGFAAAFYARAPSGILVNGLRSAAEPAASEPVPEKPLEASLDDALPPASLSIESELSSTDDLSGTSPSHDLDVLLRQLEECTSAGQYLDLARRATLIAERAFDEGRVEDCFRVAARLAAHAESRPSERLRELAESFLRSLVQGARLDDLVARVAHAGDSAELAASQVLLGLGDACVPALLDAATALEGQPAREHIIRALITLGDHTPPALLDRLKPGEATPRLRAAVRIAGELQHPAAVEPLVRLLEADDRGVREEAVRALVRVGSEAAVSALAKAARSEAEGLAAVALQGLGSSGDARAVPPLAAALEAAIAARDVPRGKEVIRALARLGRPEAARGLASLLERRVRLGGGWLRELKAAAVAALGALPGDEAVAALAQAAQARDTQLRRAAETALDRRARARARAGA